MSICGIGGGLEWRESDGYVLDVMWKEISVRSVLLYVGAITQD